MIGSSKIENFVCDYLDQKTEAEEKLGVTVSADEELWDSNGYSQWSDGGEWTQTEFDNVVLITTYLAMKLAKNLCVTMSPTSFDEPTTFEESSELPIVGRQTSDRWIVHGYVSATRRIIRSAEGSSYGQWYLQSIEPDASPTVMKYSLLSETGAGITQTFEKR